MQRATSKRAAFLLRSPLPLTMPAITPRTRRASDPIAKAGLRVLSTTMARRATPTRPSSKNSSPATCAFARGRLKHSYPHSWRSKKPVIFRNTPQWFVYMDKDLGDQTTLRSRALAAIDETRFVPAGGQNRLRAMIEDRPDWVLSRQRAWGVPICVFADENGNVLKDDGVNARILEAFEAGRRRCLVCRRRT